MVNTNADCSAYPESTQSNWVYVNPTATHEYTIIFLHDLGGSPSGFQHYFEDGGALYKANQRVVIPASPSAVVTAEASAGAQNSWFDF